MRSGPERSNSTSVTAEHTEVVSTRDQRIFGFAVGAGFALLFGVLPILRGRAPSIFLLIPSFVFWVLAALLPGALAPFRRVWIRFGALMAWINTRVALTLMFYLLVAPTGLAMRIFKRDRLGLGLDPARVSYRVKSSRRSADSLKRPY